MNADTQKSPQGTLGRKIALYFAIGAVVFVLLWALALLTARHQAAAILADAENQAAAILADARRKAENAHRDLLAGRLEGLQEYPSTGGWIVINKGYLTGFEREGGVVKYGLFNSNKFGDVKPNFSVRFYDDTGVTTGVAEVRWLVQRVGPGEKANDEQSITGRDVSSRPTKYYLVEFH